MNELENLYAYPKEWINVGDINPERHGGMFIKWEYDMWHCIETRHYADMHDSVSENEHMFEHMWVEPMDIWIKGDPYEGFTDRMLNGFDSFSNLPFVPFNPEDSDSELPEGETYGGYVEWHLNNEWERLLPLIIHSLRGYVDSDPINYSPQYWEYLEEYGINREKF